MGARTFIERVQGPTAEQAFARAVHDASLEHGFSGETGTIAEKEDFVPIPLPAGMNAEAYAETLIQDRDPRITDKWGPAGCLNEGPQSFIFFGWAPC